MAPIGSRKFDHQALFLGIVNSKSQCENQKQETLTWDTYIKQSTEPWHILIYDILYKQVFLFHFPNTSYWQIYRRRFSNFHLFKINQTSHDQV